MLYIVELNLEASAMKPTETTGESLLISGDTPTLRLFSLLEAIAGKDQHFTLQALVEETGLPKPTVHRMLQQLESAGILSRDQSERRYSVGLRMRKLAENLLINDTMHGARHTILRNLVDQVGESCNLTTFTDGEVLYLDRVETSAPLRFYQRPGSRVPAHSSACGKLFMAQLTPAQRQRLLGHAPLTRFTSNTLTDLALLEAECSRALQQGFALDNEEYLPGLVCIGVLVPASNGGLSNLALALQAPTMRLPVSRIEQYLPALQQAAEALAALT